MPFGANLKRLLASKGISVTELANKTGINRATLYSYLRRDTKKIDPDVIRKLISVLGEEAIVLYDREDVTEIIWDELPKNVSPDESELILKWRGLDAYGQKAVRAVLDAEVERCFHEAE